MPLMKRGLLISSALLTLSFFASNEYMKDVQAQAPAKLQGDSSEKPLIYKVNEDSYDLFHAVLPSSTEQYIHRHVSSVDVYTDYVLHYAFEQGKIKFGPTISSKISTSFEEEILPRLKQVVTETTAGLTSEEWKQIKLSTHPASGLGEKIFHLYNEESGNDLIRFHVRRDQPPKQGYWFNFHYHTYVDNYEKHHNLGSIYWGKDMPPRWMA